MQKHSPNECRKDNWNKNLSTNFGIVRELRPEWINTQHVINSLW